MHTNNVNISSNARLRRRHAAEEDGIAIPSRSRKTQASGAVAARRARLRRSAPRIAALGAPSARLTRRPVDVSARGRQNFHIPRRAGGYLSGRAPVTCVGDDPAAPDLVSRAAAPPGSLSHFLSPHRPIRCVAVSLSETSPASPFLPVTSLSWGFPFSILFIPATVFDGTFFIHTVVTCAARRARSELAAANVVCLRRSSDRVLRARSPTRQRPPWSPRQLPSS